MRQRCSLFLAWLLLAACARLIVASGQVLTLDHWAYRAMEQLQAAGLLPEYPAEWIARGHPLTRHEFAFYIRTVILRLGQREEGDRRSLPSAAELALGRLAAEFANELRALGVNVQPWTGQETGPPFIDLDTLIGAIDMRPEVPPIDAPPNPHAADGLSQSTYQIELPVPSPTYSPQPMRLDALTVPLPDFGDPASTLVNLAGEVLGVEWTLGLESAAYQEVQGIPLRVGSFLITNEQQGTGGFGLKVGDQLGVGFNAFWFLDLDQAKMAMARLLLDLNTRVELNERLGLFGGVTVDYRLQTLLPTEPGTEASAGLRVLLGGNTYLIAEYSLTNPFSETRPRIQGTTLGLSLGDVGLILLGMQAADFSDLAGLELTGEFIYRF